MQCHAMVYLVFMPTGPTRPSSLWCQWIDSEKLLQFNDAYDVDTDEDEVEFNVCEHNDVDTSKKPLTN